MNIVELKDKIIQLSSVNINDEEKEKLNIYKNMIIEHNKFVNLTAITNENEIDIKHFEDSLYASSIIKGEVLDIGAGAGLPSIPLAIVKKDVSFTLIDSVNKKVKFMQSVKERLLLDNIDVLHSRVEDLKKDKLYDFIVVRAVASLNILIEYSLPFLKKGGRLIAYKGLDYENELISAVNAIKILGGKFDKIYEYSLKLDGQDINRYLIIIKKENDSPSKYPRGGNKARLNPIL